MQRTYVALDLEFTGLDPQHDDIIEIGMVKFAGDQVLETFSSLVKSQRPVPLKIQQLIGVSQADIDEAPSLPSLIGRIIGFVKTYPIVGHNVEMDLRFLRRYGLLLNNLPIDTFELASILLPEAQRYTLGNLAQLLGIALPQQHHALNDAMATKDLFLKLVARIEQWDEEIVEEITRLSEQSDWPLRQVFRDVVQERGERRDGRALLGQRSATALSREMPLQREETFRPLEPTPEITPLDVDALAALISPGGLFERAFPGYEHRPQQVEMLKAVAEAFNIPAHLLIEAGTGTGKSLAYLLPAAYFAVANGRRVVVASNTINLQDQLYTKDIPDLQRILPISFQAAILKGRSNYLCLRRFAAFRRARRLTAEEARVLAKVLAWLAQTKTGDRAELTLVNNDLNVWASIQADSANCMGEHCPFRQAQRCFFYRARARAERAHLIVVNHALLLSDLALDNCVLPEFKYLIVDEAHHLEEQATEQFGIHVGRRDVYAFLTGLYHEGGEAPGGLLAEVPRLFQQEGLSASAQQAITASIEELRAQIDAAQRHLHGLFEMLTGFLENQGHLRPGYQETYDQNISLTSGLRSQPGWAMVEVAWEGFSAPMEQVVRGLERLLDLLESADLGENAARDELAQEISAQLQHGSELWGGLSRILIEPEPGGIYWITISGRDQEISLHSALLHVGPTLQEKLFANMDCVVLTSATLRTGNDFRFIKERLGLQDPIELAVDSPFNFQTAVLLYVPKDIPEPNQPNYQRTIEQAIVELCRATEGRTLVLFTSNSQLNATYRAVQRPLEEDEIVVFGQGLDGSRRQILDNFRSTPKSVLMGTRSFWEGVDVVGQALSCLVIAKLPFAVPTDPVLSARAGTYSDPFNEYYLPDAILRFRQGFGRLIRSKSDYGVVVVLDKRLLTKSYGKMILRSLPPCTARQGPLESLPAVARRWLDPANRK